MQDAANGMFEQTLIATFANVRSAGQLDAEEGEPASATRRAIGHLLQAEIILGGGNLRGVLPCRVQELLTGTGRLPSSTSVKTDSRMVCLPARVTRL